jgi:GNAT superfamily N-acetyltransferase
VATISLATTDAEILRCFPVMAQLRPHLVQSEFVAQVHRQARQGNYALAWLEEQGEVLCVAGFRVSECLFYGKFLYVDDLVTAEGTRSRGHGRALFDWLVQHAKGHGCATLALDSGVQRFDAHRFYLGRRMNIVCHHFALKLG